MAFQMKHTNALLPLTMLAVIVSTGYTPRAHAQETAYPDPAGEKQCSASDINDSINAIGNCNPASANGFESAWYAAAPGQVPTLLPALVSGQSCFASGLDDQQDVFGSCGNTNGNRFGVRWSGYNPTEAPTELTPLPGLLGVLGDVSSSITGYNQKGVAIGESNNAYRVGTAVLWAAGSANPTLVSSAGDNCMAIDVDDNGTSTPNVALDCPNANGTVTAKFAGPFGLLGAYTQTALPLPAGYSYCTVSGLNDNDQMVGTCHTVAPDMPVAAYWASPTSTPSKLGVIINGVTSRVAGLYINSAGHIAFAYQTANGVVNPGFWNPGATIIKLIPTLSGTLRSELVGIGDNDTVTMNCEDSAENVQACEWTQAKGTVALGDLNNGSESAITATNKGGTAAAVSGEGSSENDNGGEVGL